MSEQTVNIGLIGTGRIGRIHAQNLATRIPEANLVAVADVVIDSAEEVGARFGVSKIFEDYQEILEDPEVRAVAICSSTNTHAQIIQDAASAGKHIFCEKPIDLELKRIDKALAAVEAAGVKLQVGFNRRFDPNFRKVRQLA
ncbi:MAG: Gfo/Idh/MocA family oxidoreductase, partial [Chloroflexi bacterium]|nr:Gfo/Idh/MocA family oxidoreductase [Chloroflexota bacterium]